LPISPFRSDPGSIFVGRVADRLVAKRHQALRHGRQVENLDNLLIEKRDDVSIRSGRGENSDPGVALNIWVSGSVIVGTSGTVCERVLPVTASARNLPWLR
jgi:hypothetical protein